ncbi:MAG: hypothetical protein J0665_20150 [Deltaproteobacteria bacterium]|nr:hypothetical protein [Deltaproteobacteria bacterium]
MRPLLLTPPLKGELTGLQSKIDRFDETDITKELADCIQFILIETSRLDCEVRR